MFRQSIETSNSKFNNCVALLSVKPVIPLQDVVNIGASLKIFESYRYWHPRTFKTHAPLTLPGTLSTAEHYDQSRVAILVPNL